MTELDDKLAEVARQYDDVQAELVAPGGRRRTPSEIRRLGQELAGWSPSSRRSGVSQATRAELAGARELRDAGDGDDEMHAMARDEIDRLEADEARLLDGAQGAAAARATPTTTATSSWRSAPAPAARRPRCSPTSCCGCTSATPMRHKFTPRSSASTRPGSAASRRRSSRSHGDGAYSRLKFEGGVHRVQRVPSTESSGRIHTSTATVVVMPEADEVEIEIDEDRDLRIDVKRSSGPGGQSVNTTDSAVRITHLPTGPRRRDPGREEPAQEQGQGDVGPAVAAARPASCSSSARPTRPRAARWSARATAPRRSGPTTSRTTG